MTNEIRAKSNVKELSEADLATMQHLAGGRMNRQKVGGVSYDRPADVTELENPYLKAYYTFCEERRYASGTTIKVQLDSLLETEFNARTAYPREEVEARKKSLLANGQRHPISLVVSPDYPRKFLVQDGMTRVRAASELAQELPDDPRWMEMDAVVCKVRSPFDIYQGSLLSNEYDDLHAVDRARRWAALIDKHGVTMDQLIQLTGHDSQHLYRFLRFGRIVESNLALREKLEMHPGRIVSTHFDDISYVTDRDEKAGVEFVSAIVDKKWSPLTASAQRHKFTGEVAPGKGEKTLILRGKTARYSIKYSPNKSTQIKMPPIDDAAAEELKAMLVEFMNRKAI